MLSNVGPDLKAPKFTQDQFRQIMTDQVKIPWKKKEVGEWFSEFDKNDTGKIFYPFFVNYMKTFGELNLGKDKFLEMFGEQYYDGTWLRYKEWLDSNFDE